MRKLLSMLAVALISLSAPVLAEAEQDGYYVACLLANTSLAPENQRFYCSCKNSLYQSMSVSENNAFDTASPHESCLETINPYYQYLHDTRLEEDEASIEWTWEI